MKEMEPQMDADARRSAGKRIGILSVHLGCLAILLLLGSGCQQLEGAASFGQRLTDFATGRTALNSAVRMESQAFPDERREGINGLSSRTFGRKEPYTTRYQQIAQSDKDWLVRATAIRALNRSRDASATPIFVKALADESDLVRTEACKALVHMPDQTAVAPLVKLVSDPGQQRDVRIWAANALKHYPTLEVARTLASQLNNRDFSVAWQSHQSLVDLTGKDMNYSEPAWLQYLATTQNPFG